MSLKEKLYSLIILTTYLLCCLLIFNHEEEQPSIQKKHTELTPSSIQTQSFINQKEKNKFVQNPDQIGKLEIKKINLERPLYKIESPRNQVNSNITILKESTYPDQQNSLLILAAHSGNSSVSFFEKLDELEKEDQIKITYLNQEYLYQVTNIWEEEKNGYIHVNYQEDKTLILTTCSPTHENKQLIVESKII